MIQSGSSAGLQNKHEPEKQYVTRKNYIGFRGKKVKVRLFKIMVGQSLSQYMTQ